MTTKHFETKEQYLNFRAAWASAVNDERVKKKLVTKVWSHNGTKEEYKERVPGWISAAHHMLYNILRNKPFDNGFTPVTKPSKLLNGHSPNYGLYMAANHLKSVIRDAKKVTGEIDISYLGNSAARQEGALKRTLRFLEPFNKTVSIELLASFEPPKVELIYPTFGKGIKIVDKIVSGNMRTLTYSDLQELYEAA